MWKKTLFFSSFLALFDNVLLVKRLISENHLAFADCISFLVFQLDDVFVAFFSFSLFENVDFGAKEGFRNVFDFKSFDVSFAEFVEREDIDDMLNVFATVQVMVQVYIAIFDDEGFCRLHINVRYFPDSFDGTRFVADDVGGNDVRQIYSMTVVFVDHCPNGAGIAPYFGTIFRHEGELSETEGPHHFLYPCVYANLFVGYGISFQLDGEARDNP